LGQPADCFLSHCLPAFDCCDFLALWIERIRPSRGFQDAAYPTGGRLWDRCCNLGSVVDFGLTLVRPCYPTLVDDAFNPFPSASDQQAATELLMVDARILMCCLQQASCAGDLFPSNTNCLEIGWGDLTPECPDGGCAGWTWRFTVELEACC